MDTISSLQSRRSLTVRNTSTRSSTLRRSRRFIAAQKTPLSPFPFLKSIKRVYTLLPKRYGRLQARHEHEPNDFEFKNYFCFVLRERVILRRGNGWSITGVNRPMKSRGYCGVKVFTNDSNYSRTPKYLRASCVYNLLYRHYISCIL